MQPEPPYYAVIFTSQLRVTELREYDSTAQAMLSLARTMPGYLGYESAHESGFGVTVSYWDSLEAIAAWRDHEDHRRARENGRALWYARFDVRIARVERTYGWSFDAKD